MPLYDYKDYAFTDLSELPVPKELKKAKRKGPRGGVQVPFPEKLHNLLEEHSHEEVISWAPHGRCFVVHRPNEFVNKVMPQYFQQSKLTSFQRQLNLYGFTRILQSGPDKGGYYHACFLRGKKDLCSRIVRMRVKGPSSRIAPNPDLEPRFYKMRPLPQSPKCKGTSNVYGMNTKYAAPIPCPPTSTAEPPNVISYNQEDITVPSSSARLISPLQHKSVLGRMQIKEDPYFGVNDFFLSDTEKRNNTLSSLPSVPVENLSSCLPPLVTSSCSFGNPFDFEDDIESWSDGEFDLGCEDDLLQEARNNIDQAPTIDWNTDLTQVFET